MTDDKCPKCGAEVKETEPANEYKRWSEVYFKCGSSVTEWPGGEKQWMHSNACELTTARTRIAELEQQLEMSRDPMVIDESRWLDERNAGAESLARSILGDTGTGSMSPGPCADLQELVRGLRQQLAAKTRECERWERLRLDRGNLMLDGFHIVDYVAPRGYVVEIPPTNRRITKHLPTIKDALAAIEAYEAQQAAEVKP